MIATEPVRSCQQCHDVFALCARDLDSESSRLCIIISEQLIVFVIPVSARIRRHNLESSIECLTAKAPISVVE